jgi:hypothetical protein
MGLLPQWYHGEPSAVREIAHGLDFYYGAYSDIGANLQPVIQYTREQPDEDE